MKLTNVKGQEALTKVRRENVYVMELTEMADRVEHHHDRRRHVAVADMDYVSAPRGERRRVMLLTGSKHAYGPSTQSRKGL